MNKTNINYFPYSMEKLIHRLKKYIDHKGMSMRQFDLSVSASDGYIQRTYKNSSSVGSDLIEKIIATYTDLNPYWLVTGKGEMLKEIESENHAFEETAADYEKDLFELTLLKYLDKPRIQDKIKNIMKDEEGEESDR